MSKRQIAMLATWGEKAQPGIRLLSWKPIVKGALRGFATIELPNGLTVVDCPVLLGPNGAWAACPSKPVLDNEGKHFKADGKPQYTPILQWRTRDLARRFSDEVVALVRAADPDALAEAEPTQTCLDI
jgi:hypothetical protein